VNEVDELEIQLLDAMLEVLTTQGLPWLSRAGPAIAVTEVEPARTGDHRVNRTGIDRRGFFEN
jgi:hypothetical protein